MASTYQDVLNYYTDKIPENKWLFENKMENICQKLGIPSIWLYQIMLSESGMNSHIVNSVGATGLIQFMPTTAQTLGTATSALKNMSNVEQLDYVYKYFAPYKYDIRTYTDMYLVTFFPRAIGKADSWTIQASGLSAQLIARQNPGLDTNKDDKITVGEVKNVILSKVPADYRDEFKKVYDSAGKLVLRNRWPLIGGLTAIAMAFVVWHYRKDLKSLFI